MNLSEKILKVLLRITMVRVLGCINVVSTRMSRLHSFVDTLILPLSSAFWDRALQQGTVVVSDPTTNGIPVGVDFYFIGETGDQFGPFGALYPLQVNNETGRGVFRCTESTPFIDLVTSNGTGPPRQRMLRRDGLFDNYLWLGE